MTRKGLLATLGVLALAAPSAFADKGGIPHDGSNGQGRPAADQTQTTTSTQAQSHGKAQAKGHAKTHVKTQAKAKGHAKTQTQAPAANTHAKAGRTTICHATGSATNPYVTITISDNALPAHRRHQDGRDIIPAPADGCPTAQQQPGASTQGGSTSTQGSSTEGASANGATPTGHTEVLGETVSGSSTPSGSTGNGSVQGASASGSSPSASSSPAATATRAAGSNGLPFTGTDAILLAILGLAVLLAGVTARRVATTNRRS